MNRLLLFNPENDIALSYPDWHYTPTKSVRDFHNAGALLPLWYADRQGDMVYAPNADKYMVEQRIEQFGLPTRLYDGTIKIEPSPWGFSMHALMQYRHMGVEIDLQQWRQRVEEIRLLSHRRTAAELLSRLRAVLPYPLPEQPIEAYTVDDIVTYATHNPRFFMKAPWSSSGRGVVDSLSIPREQILRQAEGIIRRQGSVMIEPALNKIIDFASLYEATPSGVNHIGYSLFFNARGSTAYGGNYVASDIELLNIITRHVDTQTIVRTVQAVANALTDMNIHRSYTGYFGVDMMIYDPCNGSGPLIAPSIEINLRMTMGVVAHKLYENLLNEGVHGVLSVRYAPDEPYIDTFVAQNFRLCSGCLNLIPPHNGFRITLTVSDSI